MERISNERLKQEIAAGYKPLALDAGLSSLPYVELSDRDFENLVYCLIRSEIENQLEPIIEFDDIALMQGVGERGRDCVLYGQGEVVGSIQCKNLKARMPRPTVIKELIKFLLFSLIDPSIKPATNRFIYHLYAPGGLTGPAIPLSGGFHSEIKTEIDDGRLHEYLRSVVSEYESFERYVGNEPFADICEAMKNLEFKVFESVDLNVRIPKQHKVLTAFFHVTLVVETQAVIQDLEQRWNTAGLNLLTDSSLRSLHSRLGSVDNSHRIGLGTIDLYGYSMSFMRYLDQSGFVELLKKTNDVRSFLDSQLTNFIASKIAGLLFDEITVPFVTSGIIIPFTASIINQYLLKAALPKLVEASEPSSMFSMMHPTALLSDQELLMLVLNYNIDGQIRVSKGDYSIFPNPDPDRIKRLQLFEMLRDGCDVSLLEDRFWKDYALVKRVAASILSDVISEFSGIRTVIIKDSSFLRDSAEAVNVLAALKEIDWTRGKPKENG